MPATITTGVGRRRALVIVVAPLVLVADAATKAWARRALIDGPAPYGPLELRLGFNPGVAFGLGADAPRGAVFALTALVVALLILVAARLRPAPAAGLIAGGGLANLVDRAGDGTVTDFLAVGWWPTFNVADAAICIGAAWLVLSAWHRPSDVPRSASITPQKDSA